MKECKPKHKTYHVLMQQACTSYRLIYTATSLKSLQDRISCDYKVYNVKWHRIERVDYNY